jgi:hypothetical protein
VDATNGVCGHRDDVCAEEKTDFFSVKNLNNRLVPGEFIKIMKFPKFSLDVIGLIGIGGVAAGIFRIIN